MRKRQKMTPEEFKSSMFNPEHIEDVLGNRLEDAEDCGDQWENTAARYLIAIRLREVNETLKEFLEKEK